MVDGFGVPLGLIDKIVSRSEKVKGHRGDNKIITTSCLHNYVHMHEISQHMDGFADELGMSLAQIG